MMKYLLILFISSCSNRGQIPGNSFTALLRENPEYFDPDFVLSLLKQLGGQVLKRIKETIVGNEIDVSLESENISEDGTDAKVDAVIRELIEGYPINVESLSMRVALRIITIIIANNRNPFWADKSVSMPTVAYLLAQPPKPNTIDPAKATDLKLPSTIDPTSRKIVAFFGKMCLKMPRVNRATVAWLLKFIAEMNCDVKHGRNSYHLIRRLLPGFVTHKGGDELHDVLIFLDKTISSMCRGNIEIIDAVRCGTEVPKYQHLEQNLIRTPDREFAKWDNF